LKKNEDYENPYLRVSYETPVKPKQILDLEILGGEKRLLKKKHIPTYDEENYVTKKMYAPSHDGKKIPIIISYRKGLDLSKPNKCLLNAYGSYGAKTEPRFVFHRASLMDRGFIFVKAQIRGGAELGQQWYKDGKFLNKKNTFLDFVSCSDFLIEKGYTSPELLCAMGGSAGGLLMGAIINLKPENFKAVIAAVPFVDTLNTMLDSTLPLTTLEYDEWGNPNDLEFYQYIKSYSPYDNLQKVHYPNILATAGFNDPRVTYWEPAKWIARMRDQRLDENDQLLYVDMDSGHAGASGRYNYIQEIAMMYSFLIGKVENL
jgi:oligopeptidase B